MQHAVSPSQEVAGSRAITGSGPCEPSANAQDLPQQPPSDSSAEAAPETSPGQCCAATAKGQRCHRAAKVDGFCLWHANIFQPGPAPVSSPTPRRRPAVRAARQDSSSGWGAGQAAEAPDRSDSGSSDKAAASAAAAFLAKAGSAERRADNGAAQQPHASSPAGSCTTASLQAERGSQAASAQLNGRQPVEAAGRVSPALLAPPTPEPPFAASASPVAPVLRRPAGMYSSGDSSDQSAQHTDEEAAGSDGSQQGADRTAELAAEVDEVDDVSDTSSELAMQLALAQLEAEAEQPPASPTSTLSPASPTTGAKGSGARCSAKSLLGMRCKRAAAVGGLCRQHSDKAAKAAASKAPSLVLRSGQSSLEELQAAAIQLAAPQEVSGISRSCEDVAPRVRSLKSWLAVWRQLAHPQGPPLVQCCAQGCGMKAEVGAHVWRFEAQAGRYEKAYCYIVPTCAAHNSKLYDYPAGYFRTKPATTFLRILPHESFERDVKHSL